jgi:hypothetical protein
VAVAKEIGVRWKALGEEAKKPYEAQAAADKARHATEMEGYEAPPVKYEKAKGKKKKNNKASPKASVKKAVGAYYRGIALLIGVGDYDHVDTLIVDGINHPQKDVRGIEASLKSLGFQDEDTTVVLDGTKREITDAVGDVAMKVEARKNTATGEKTIVFVYFAGHGMQIPAEEGGGGNSKNYLIAKDTPLPSAKGGRSSLARYALDLQTDVINKLTDYSNEDFLFVFMLDCCRNNALMVRSLQASKVLPTTRAMGGPSNIDMSDNEFADQRKGDMVLMYSTEANKVANNTSVFAPKVAELLRDGTFIIPRLFSQVNDAMRGWQKPVVRQQIGDSWHQLHWREEEAKQVCC